MNDDFSIKDHVFDVNQGFLVCSNQLCPDAAKTDLNNFSFIQKKEYWDKINNCIPSLIESSIVNNPNSSDIIKGYYKTKNETFYLLKGFYKTKNRCIDNNCHLVPAQLLREQAPGILLNYFYSKI